MITFNELGQKGRLGNQLFQIASTIGIATKNGNTYGFPDWENRKYFEKELPISTSNGIEVQEFHFHYSDINFPDTISTHFNLTGFFQSERYFSHCKEKIKEQFKFKDTLISQVRNYYDEQEVFTKPTIAISIRRGDYVNNKNYLQLPVTYFLSCLFAFTEENLSRLEEYNIIIFSDDIDYCKLHFGGLPNIYFSEGNSPIEDLCLMSQCDHFIISNSTFSWWGAWLGEKEHSIIFRPDGLFDGDLKQKNLEIDFYPSRWIPKKETKIYLNDVTFCIPILLDSNDRKENLDLCIKHIKKHFNTKIIVTEEIDIPITSVIEEVVLENRCTYMKSNNKEFHRTKMLNDMFKSANTSYVANWDADVLISPISIYLSVVQLRQGVTMVFPYEWAFARIPRNPYYKDLLWTLDIGIVGTTLFNGMHTSDVPSYGGAVFVNKEDYLKIGGENENFISFGAEDVERVVRTKKLEYSITRVPGVLYHLQHWVGINSSTRNPFFLQNKLEYEKVEKMTKEELLNYIKTWHWI